MITKLTYIKGSKPIKSILSNSSISHNAHVSGSFVSAQRELIIDPILDNNSWEVIRIVCENGEAGNYWAVGDVKNVIGGDGNKRKVKMVDTTGLYGKHVVFQFINTTDATYKFNDGFSNDYSTSLLRVTSMPTIKHEILSNELAMVLTDTTFKVAQNGKSTTLIEVTEKLFVPAEKELRVNRNYSVQEEFDALTTFEYWQTNSTDNPHILRDSQNVAHNYWNRSPRTDSDTSACFINTAGTSTKQIVSNPSTVTVCFSF